MVFLVYPFSVNFQDQWTPLHYAAWKGQTETCGLLVKCGAAVDALDKVRDGIMRKVK